MSKITKFSLIAALAVFVTLTGCESNDNPTLSTYIPQPVNRKVLVEFFTNSGCIPCIDAHHYFDQIKEGVGVTPNDTSVIILSYHTNFPNIGDSLYRANIPQNNDRINYYSVGSTPQGRADGNDMQDFSSTVWTAHIKAEMYTTKYMNVTFENNYIASSDSGYVTVNIQTVAGLPTTDNNLFIVITEDSVAYITAPNGIHYPSDVMRTMLTGSGGTPIGLVNGQTTQYSIGYNISNRWRAQMCNIIAFVQSTSTKQVYGVEKIKVVSP
jgi:hypothetical protein